MSNWNEKKKILKEIIIEHLSSINLYGVPKIFKSQHLSLKLFFLTCFLGSLACCVAMLVGLCQNFYSYPTNIDTNLIQEIPTKFPMVSFCNMKSLNVTQSINFLNSSQILAVLDKILLKPS